MNLLAENSSNGPLNMSGAIAFTIVGFICLVVAIGTLFFYLKKRKEKQNQETKEFKVVNKNFKNHIFSFWINYVFIFLIVVGFIGAIVFIPLGINGIIIN